MLLLCVFAFISGVCISLLLHSQAATTDDVVGAASHSLCIFCTHYFAHHFSFFSSLYCCCCARTRNLWTLFSIPAHWCFFFFAHSVRWFIRIIVCMRVSEWLCKCERRWKRKKKQEKLWHIQYTYLFRISLFAYSQIYYRSVWFLLLKLFTIVLSAPFIWVHNTIRYL